MGDCWSLPSTPLAPNPEGSSHCPLGNLPNITRTGLSPGTLQRGAENGLAHTALCTRSNSSRAGGTQSSSENPAVRSMTGPTETGNIKLLHRLCKRRKGFLLHHLSISTSAQSWGMTICQRRIKLERSGARRACQEQAPEWSCATQL